MSNIIPFDFNKRSIRVWIDENGDPWFVAIDVAEVLEYSDPYEMTKKLEKDEVQNRQFAGFGNRGINLINEAGLYSVTLTSQKSEAKSFKRWITHDVLPSIRKTGSYSVPQTIQSTPKSVIEANRVFKSFASVAKQVFKGNQALLSANQATLKTTGVNVLDAIGATHLLAHEQSQDMVVSDVAKVLGISSRKVNPWFQELGFQTSRRDHKNRLIWELTPEGEKFAHYVDTGKKHGDGSPVKQIKWSAKIVDYLKDRKMDA